MLQVRFHGRGGQGVVTAAELLSLAAFADGNYAQAFPTFGSERTGAPVMAFCRINRHEIRSREPVTNPNVVIVQDPTLLHQVDLFAGLDPSGFVLINSNQTLADLSIEEFLHGLPAGHVCVFPASEIGLKHLGRPLANVPLLGACSAMTGVVSLEAVLSAIRRKFSGRIADANAAAGAEAYKQVTASLAEPKGVNTHA